MSDPKAPRLLLKANHRRLNAAADLFGSASLKTLLSLSEQRKLQLLSRDVVWFYLHIRRGLNYIQAKVKRSISEWLDVLRSSTAFPPCLFATGEALTQSSLLEADSTNADGMVTMTTAVEPMNLHHAMLRSPGRCGTERVKDADWG